MLQARDELGNKYAEAHKKKKKIKAIKESQRPSSDYKSLSVSIVELAESV